MKVAAFLLMVFAVILSIPVVIFRMFTSLLASIIHLIIGQVDIISDINVYFETIQESIKKIFMHNEA